MRAAELVEDAVHAVIGAVLRRSHRYRPMIVPFVGHGTPERVRIRGRVILGPPAAAAQGLVGPDAPPGGAAERRSRWAVLRASLSRFLTVEVPGAVVTIRTGVTTTAYTDREGYLDAPVDRPGLGPGWHEVELALAQAPPVSAPLLVVDPRARLAVVSDVDDTIIETGLTRGLEFLRATLLTDVGERTPLPGASALYRALVEVPHGPGRPIFYVSTSPWNLHEKLLEFIALRGFPPGPLLLTDWGPGHGNLFRIGAREHKLGLIRGLLVEHPHLDLVLIGDTGQLDPEIYAAVAHESPGRIRAVYVRCTVPADPRRADEVDALAARVAGAGVSMLAVEDSLQIAAHAVSIGLLDVAALDAVRAETAP